MERGEDKVTGERRLDRDLGGFQITGFPDHDAIWILTKEGPEGAGEGDSCGLVDRNLKDSVDFIFYGILGCQELGVDRVDLVQASVEGGRFSRACGSADDENAVWFFNNLQDVLVDLFGHLECFEIQFHGTAIQHAEHHALPELGWQAGDTKIYDFITNLTLDASILRDTAFGDIQVSHHLET